MRLECLSVDCVEITTPKGCPALGRSFCRFPRMTTPKGLAPEFKDAEDSGS